LTGAPACELGHALLRGSCRPLPEFRVPAAAGRRVHTVVIGQPADVDVMNRGELMQNVLLMSSTWLAALAFMGCTSGPSEIEIRHTGQHVSASSFQCTGTWPSPLTPCEYAGPSQPYTFASSENQGTVVLHLGRMPILIDGDESWVSMELIVGADGQILSATANESRSSGLSGKLAESSNATGGWVDPDAVSATPAGRNAGTFSLSFPFGTIRGTYDTAAQP
jgi:hypothetical protein